MRKKITQGELETFAAQHKLWLDTRGMRGTQAKLNGADLSGLAFCGMDFSSALMSNCLMLGVNLSDAIFKGTQFNYSDIRLSLIGNANLERAGFRGAVLQELDFTEVTSLRNTVFSQANLHAARLDTLDLSLTKLDFADLSNSSLRKVRMTDTFTLGMNLHAAVLNGSTIGPELSARLSILPDEGDVYGWKRCSHGSLAKLLVSSETPRTNANGRKCRAAKAYVLRIEEPSGAVHREAWSVYDPSCIYMTGQSVVPHAWGLDRWTECAPGIHFFITREEAIRYVG